MAKCNSEKLQVSTFSLSRWSKWCLPKAINHSELQPGYNTSPARVSVFSLKEILRQDISKFSFAISHALASTACITPRKHQITSSCSWAKWVALIMEWIDRQNISTYSQCGFHKDVIVISADKKTNIWFCIQQTFWTGTNTHRVNEIFSWMI